MFHLDYIIKRHKMEFKSVVFNAARDGKLHRLKISLDHKPRDEVELLVSLRTNGATPLVVACRNGHLGVVLYLIEKCHADVEQVGSVIFDGETIEDAPPLWCAAAAGHLSIVKTLVRYKASVNSTTKTSSTPLRAACFDGHFEIAKYLIQHGADIEIANKHGHTCLMIACYKGHYEIAKYLIECGANVNRKSAKGNTALHDCAESGSLEILKLLLEHGAECDCDSHGNTPLLSAAVSGHATIVEYFIEEFDCSKEEKINALELLGATCMDKKQDMIGALSYWRQAMLMRYENSELPIEKPTTQSPIASYIDAVEVRNFEELDDLISDPDEVRMQALLVRERILGPGHPDTHYFLKYRGAMYADNGNFNKCIQLWMYALDVQQGVQEPLSPVTQNSLLSFAELFSYMMSKASSFSTDYPAVLFKDVFGVFERAVKEIESAMKSSEKKGQDLTDCSHFHRTLVISLHLIGLMCKLQSHLNKTEELELKRSVYKLVLMDPRTRKGWSLLHLACSKDSSTIGRYPLISFPSPEVVDLLLEVGACPNAVDLSGSTPLHIIAKKPCLPSVFKALLNYGAHLDFRNGDGKTALDIDQNSPLLGIYPLQYINLQCLSAQVVRSHKILYRGLVHKRLEKFLDMH